MADSDVLDLALRLWPQARDRGDVGDPADLDRLIEAQGRPGAPGQNCGQRYTFACFPPEAGAELSLPTGERANSDEDARFIGHLLVTRTLLAVGLSVDERVLGAMCDAHARSWATSGGGYHQSPLALAVSLWLVALDPSSQSDRPLPIDWAAECFRQHDHWDPPDDRLFSHYDIRQRALDWAMYVAIDPGRHAGVSIWTIVEPLLRLQQDHRVRVALDRSGEAADAGGEQASAAAMLERNRIAGLLRVYLGLADTTGGPPGTPG